MCYLLNHLPITAHICLSSQNIGSHSLRVSKWEWRICPEDDNTYFWMEILRKRKNMSVRNRVRRGFRSEYYTENLFICVRTLTGNLYWQLWACFTLVYCLTINYSTRGAIHICALVKLFFGTDSEKHSVLRCKRKIVEVNSAQSDHPETCMHSTHNTF